MKSNTTDWIKKNWPFVLFVVMNLVGACFHECWRDEVQSLLEAKAASGPWDLISRVIRYEGHPALWHLCLRYLSIGGVHPFAMQLFNSALIISTAAIFWWRFPLPYLTRALFLFNYFFVYEYGILARSYSLGLFLFFFSVAFMDSRKKWLGRAAFIALCLMPQTSVYGALIAGGNMAYRFLRGFRSSPQRAISEAAFFAISLGLAAWQMLPPVDSGFAPGWRTEFNIFAVLEVLQRFGEVFLFIPQFKGFPLVWDVHGESMIANYARVTFVLCLMGGLGFGIWKRQRALFAAYVMAILALFLFCYTKYLGGIRHGAHFLFIVAAFYWLAARARRWQLSRQQILLLNVIAGMSAVSGVTLYVADLIYPFSDGKNAAAVIERYPGPAIVWPDFIGSTLSAYLNGREFFYLQGERSGSYIVWDNRRVETPPPTIEYFDKWMRDRKITSFILATDNPRVEDFMNQKFNLELLYRSEICMVTDECYDVLKVSTRAR